MLVDALNLAQATGPVSPLDLASGSGVWGIALAQASSHVAVHAVDWPDVLPVTRRVADRFGVGERFMMAESARNRARRIIAGDRRIGGTQPNYARCSRGASLRRAGTCQGKFIIAATNSPCHSS